MQAEKKLFNRDFILVVIGQILYLETLSYDLHYRTIC